LIGIVAIFEPTMAGKRRSGRKAQPVEESAEEDEEEEAELMDAPEESEDDGVDFDLEAIAEKAVKAAEKAAKRTNLGSIKLDIGLGAEHLGGSSSSDVFDTAAESGIYRVSLDNFGSASSSSTPSSLRDREVRGAPVRPVNDAKLRRAEAKKAREEKLDKWFGLPKHKMTPELEKELKAIKLRANFDPKRFYKAQDSQELPKYFTVATEVGGGLAPVGLHTRTPDVHAHSGRSLLSSIMQDQKAQEWTRKKFTEVSERGQAARNSGHGKRKAEGARSTRRGGAWKKKKHS